MYTHQTVFPADGSEVRFQGASKESTHTLVFCHLLLYGL